MLQNSSHLNEQSSGSRHPKSPAHVFCLSAIILLKTFLPWMNLQPFLAQIWGFFPYRWQLQPFSYAPGKFGTQETDCNSDLSTNEISSWSLNSWMTSAQSFSSSLPKQNAPPYFIGESSCPHPLGLPHLNLRRNFGGWLPSSDPCCVLLILLISYTD